MPKFTSSYSPNFLAYVVAPLLADPCSCVAGLEGRSVLLQRRSSSMSKRPSSLISMLPSFEATRPHRHAGALPAVKPPAELSTPLREATALAKTEVQMQDILM